MKQSNLYRCCHQHGFKLLKILCNQWWSPWKNCTFQETQIFHQRSNIFLGICSVRYKLGSIFFGEDGFPFPFSIFLFVCLQGQEKKRGEGGKMQRKLEEKELKVFYLHFFSLVRNRNIWTNAANLSFESDMPFSTALPGSSHPSAIIFVASGSTPVVLASGVKKQDSWAWNKCKREGMASLLLLLWHLIRKTLCPGALCSHIHRHWGAWRAHCSCIAHPGWVWREIYLIYSKWGVFSWSNHCKPNLSLQDQASWVCGS